jgi:hypothetical protein
MRSLLPILVVLACAASPLCAGLWDRDRPATLPDPYDAITGHFDRLPEVYYTARERRLASQLAGLPENPLTDAEIDRVMSALPVIDDAAVAAIRRGDYSRAIVLLDQEARLADAIRPTRTAHAREAARRASANKAACLQYRWRRDHEASDLRHARDLLAEILAEERHNSDAQWSLTEIEWLLAPPTWQSGADPVFPNLLGLRDASFRGALDDSALARNNVAGCLPFLLRRIVYEDGWRDLDVMYAYSLALALTGRGEEALFAWFRIVELIDLGAATHVADAPDATPLKRIMGKHVENVANRERAESLYAELRRQSDAWTESRATYVVEQVQLGRHPDTDPTFWSGWTPDGPPKPGHPEEPEDPAVSTMLLVGGLGGLVVVMLLILGFSVFIGRRSAPAPNVDEL